MGLFTHFFDSSDDDLIIDELDDDLAMVSTAESEAAMDAACRVADPYDMGAIGAAYFAALREMRQR